MTTETLCIMLVEDSEHDQALFKRALKGAEPSWRLSIFERADAALAAFRDAPESFAFIVADYNLPGMNGLALHKEIRAAGSAAPFVLLTGAGSEYVAVEAIKEGVDDYIVKDRLGTYLDILPVKIPEILHRANDRRARIKAEAELSRSRLEAEIIFNNSQAGILYVRLTGELAKINPRFGEILGYEDVAELAGLNMDDLRYPEEDERDWLQATLSPIVSGRRISVEFRLKRKDGSPVWCRLDGKSTSEDNAADKEAGVIWVVEDITEARRQEKIREDMDKMFRHDLKSPLNGIINIPRLLIEEGDNLTAEQVSHLKMIRQSGYMMLELINQSHDLYKMEYGTYEYAPKQVDLAAVIATLVDNLSYKAARQNVAISTLLPIAATEKGAEPRIMIQAEEMLLYSMLSNAMTNAIEASPSGAEATLTVSMNESVLIAIHNQGAVPKEIRDAFFGKYVTFGKEHGTGLGAYSARLMARMMRGDITMETDDEEGTTISIRLPLTTEKGDEAPRAPQ